MAIFRRLSFAKHRVTPLNSRVHQIVVVRIMRLDHFAVTGHQELYCNVNRVRVRSFILNGAPNTADYPPQYATVAERTPLHFAEDGPRAEKRRNGGVRR